MFGQKGLLAPNPVTVAIADVQELFLGHVGDAGDRESFLTINVNSSRGRDHWGDWLSPRVKIRVFKLIEDFVAKYSIRLRLRLGDEELRSIA